MLRFVLTFWVTILVLFTGACAHTSADTVSVSEPQTVGCWKFNGEIYVVVECPVEPTNSQSTP